MGSRVFIKPKKITKPFVPPRVLFRPAFNQWAADLLESRLVIIVAPAGYGKTSFLACASEIFSGQTSLESIKTPCNIAWYSLGQDDSDPAVFLAHLLESLGQAIPGLGDETKRTLYSVTDITRDHGIIVDQLCEELWRRERSNLNEQILVVLDDFHLAETSEANNLVVEELLKESPPYFHYCLAGRQRPTGMARFSLNHTVREIDFRQLQFSPEEIEILLRDTYQLSVTRELIGEVVRQTEGWPAGVAITAQSLQGYACEDYSKLLSSALKHREKIFVFFAEEVLQQQSAAVQEFLLHASVLETLTSEACEAVVGSAQCGEMLGRLYNTGLFLAVTQQKAEESSYRFHSLFSEYLRRALTLCRGHQYVRELHHNAAEYYAHNQQLDSALEHYWAAGQTQKALNLIKEHAQELLDRGYVEQVRSWLEQIPAALKENDYYFLYLRGFIYQHSDHALALACLEQASVGFASHGKKHLLVRSIIYMCTIYSLQNRVDKLEQASSRIPVISALTRDPWARGVLSVSALCQAAWNDKLRHSLWLIKLCQRFTLEPDWKWAMLAYSCMAYYRLGELDLALRSIEEALTMPVVYNNDIFRGMALVLYHVVLYSQDNELKGEEVRDQLWEIGERYDSHYYRSYAERARAFPHLHRGNWQQAEELLRSSLYFFTRSGNQAMALITRLDLARLESCRGRAQQELEPARQAWRELCTLHCGQGLVEQGQTLLGLVAREAGELAFAEEMLLASAKVSRGKGAKQSLAGTLLHLARLYYLKGQWNQGDNCLREGFSLAEINNYIVFWDWHRPTMPVLCRRALEQGISPDFATRLLKYWFADTPALGQTNAIHPPVKITCFGGFELAVGGLAIPHQAWKTRKVQGLFKYLVLAGGKRISREQLADMFWPDAGPEAGSASLRVSLSRLRKALDWYSHQGLSASFMLGEGKGKLWFEAGPATVDTADYQDSFEQAKTLIRRGKADAANPLLEQARKFYRGELFADDPYSEWALAERERFEMMQLELLLTLASLYRNAQSGKDNLAQECYTAALRINPYREDIYFQLMQTYGGMGEKAEAIRVYQRCRDMLKEEFGMEPGTDMQSLAVKIKK